jgi:hypothetical protein
MSLIIGTNTWISQTDADTYMAERIGAATYWVSAGKESALITAYRQLSMNPSYSFPTATTSITTAMKYAQCEQALFLIQFSDEILHRKGLQAQGVVSAGIVKEQYDQNKIDELPICQMAKNMLKSFEVDTGLAISDLERDETLDVDGNELE